MQAATMPHTKGNEIRELFENMSYNEFSTISIDEAIADLVSRHDICQDKNISFTDDGELAKRLFEIADMVEKDRAALNTIFSKRVPIAIETPAKDIDLLISFSRYYATLISQNKLWRQVNIDGGVWPENAVSSVYYTLSTIIQSSHIQLYLKHLSFGPRVVLGGQSSIDTAMIVMADADLDSAIGTLTSERVGKTDYLDRPLWYLKKIWIQEPVKDKFVKLIDELQIKEDTSSIKSMLHGFRNRNEVVTNLSKEAHIKAVTIWSGNVIAAKNIANAADKVFLVWINSYGEIGPGVSLPWSEVEHHNENPIPHELAPLKRIDGKKTIDLFYDGVWKEPLDETYWADNDTNLRAAATWKDIEKCVASAGNGYKKWRTIPLSDRQKCCHQLANRIHSNGSSELARQIRQWTECPILYGSSSSVIRDGEVEIVTTRASKGVVVIAHLNLVDLFRRMVCACVAGNAVIVVSGPQMHGIEEYCDMLSTSGFPPGVINSLSFNDLAVAMNNISKLRSVAVTCADRLPYETKQRYYWVHADESEYKSCSDEVLYTKYTRPKSVWLPLK